MVFCKTDFTEVPALPMWTLSSRVRLPGCLNEAVSLECRDLQAGWTWCPEGTQCGRTIMSEWDWESYPPRSKCSERSLKVSKQEKTPQILTVGNTH